MAWGSAMLSAASISLDQMNVSGDDSALMCDRSEPGTGSTSDNVEGTRETRASRKRLVLGAKHSGAQRSTRPRTLSGAKAAKIAASVPPREWPISKGFRSAALSDIRVTQSPMAIAQASSPRFTRSDEAGIHSKRCTFKPCFKQYRMALTDGARSQM